MGSAPVSYADNGVGLIGMAFPQIHRTTMEFVHEGERAARAV